MMDSQENVLEQAKEEVKKSEEVVENVVENTEDNVSQVENQVEEKAEEVSEATTEQPLNVSEPAEANAEEDLTKKVYTSKEEILARVREIAHDEEAPSKEEIDHLKTVFYKIHVAEREAQMKEYLNAGGDPEKYQVTPDDLEEAFKAEMNIIKEKRAKVFQAQETEKQENLKKKLEIIDKIKALATSPDEANRSYQQFKDLQQQWREIKAVPAEKANELWRNYQLYVEQFYDLLKLNNEASAHSIVCKNCTNNIARLVLYQKTCANKCGYVSRLLLPLSTSVINNISRHCALKKKKTWQRRPHFAKRWRLSTKKRTRVQAIGKSIRRKSLISKTNGRLSVSLHKR